MSFASAGATIHCHTDMHTCISDSHATSIHQSSSEKLTNRKLSSWHTQHVGRSGYIESEFSKQTLFADQVWHHLSHGKLPKACITHELPCSTMFDPGRLSMLQLSVC